MSRRTTPLTGDLYDYFLEVSLRESEVLRRLREETGELEKANMQISPEQGQFMTMLLDLMGARSALELGTFTGYSTLCIALGLPDDGEVIACDIDEEWPSFGRRYWVEAGVSDRIEFRPGRANDTLDALLEEGKAGRFDFAFIDADKRHLTDYYEKCLRLVRTGGVVAVDNTLWHGDVADPEVTDEDTKAVRGFNAMVVDDARVDLSLVPIGDGLTLLKKR
ncbi:MAG: class I SAM-dependent methyltransferase [Longimicrobiales bacterium]|nr:class I SAM-dependent methyltransferase [Longimicrobiales bacterium]